MEETTAAMPKLVKKKPHLILEILKFTLIALVIVVPFRFFIAEPFIVSGSSMSPTIHSNDYLIIDVLSEHLRTPKRGEVVVFHYPYDPAIYFVKRIIGLPGETVQIEDGAVSIHQQDGTVFMLDEPYVASENKTTENTVSVLESGEYFVMGDNRKNSSDSRVWGPLSEHFIIGRAYVRLFPTNALEYLPGEHHF